MPVTLDKPIAWESAAGDDLTMLQALQPNIVKAHTREFLTILFLRIDDQAQGRTVLKALAAQMKSAHAHLQEIKAFKTLDKKGTPYIGVGISAAGYVALGIAAGQRPGDAAFTGGMKASQLLDPASQVWDPHYRGDIHAVVMVGDQLRGPRNKALKKVRTLLAANPGVVALGEEAGFGLHNRNGEGIEHFGYVDGRSQPLFLAEDVAAEMHGTDGATNWDPGFGLGRVLVPDPAAPDPTVQHGSYFVFRKLEQDVRLFKSEERKLANRLKLKGADAERAGAMLVGRFEDGTPLTSQFADGAHNPVANDFTYDSDDEGGKCPFFGHIRKMNPRGSGGFEPVESERLHIMARRGQTYGIRTDDPNDGRIKNKPSGDVGLLFMAFNVDLGEQFEFVQKNWANNASFPAVPGGGSAPGLDQVMGQGSRPDMSCPVAWGASIGDLSHHRTTSAVPQAVHMKGGEYFFMPSLPFLRTL
ncbi:Dyp-type peroxidase [Sphingomonas sp. Tas61C01]|uniref:Dyp-type peroxidase n=1 Tax=Sphingomonas sp. Tas61C01 TaxID=3458297 RepID=UPI00403EA11F